MLEHADIIQQSQAGPSRLTSEIVPTSDDEDFFFLSQSSGKYGSSLDSAQSSRQSKQNNRDADDGEDDEDDEALLATNHSHLSRQQSQQHDAAGPALSADPSIEASRDERPTGPQTPPRISTSNLAANGLPPLSEAVNVRRSPVPPSTSTPTLHPITTLPPSRSDVDQTEFPRSIDSPPSHPTKDSRAGVVEQSTSQSEGSLAPASPAEITLVPSASQQSDATLPFAESPISFHAIALTPLLASEGMTASASPSPSRASSQQTGEQQASPQARVSMDLDSFPAHEATRQAVASDNLNQYAGRAPSPSSTPSPPPLRMPVRGAAPRSSPTLPPPPLREAPRTEQQNNNGSTLDDEQLARAAAAQPPTPPRRQLRARKAAQLNPYTLEAVRYQRALIRNDWEDAVVSQREWHRQERKRIAEEAARAQRDAQAAQGSEESQSQWLVPSSEPSSQADHEEPSVPSSPPVSSTPQVFVDIPAFDETVSLRAYASGSRTRLLSPTPSQSGRLPELAEILANSSRTNLRHQDRNKSGSATRPATYKGPRTTAPTNAYAETQTSQADEDETTPLPPPVRRKHPLRALSPSDGEGSVDLGEQMPLDQETFIVESSEDERPTTVVLKPKRRSRWSGDGSSSDSTDYERRFRQLKKMMPAGMARKHIRDLRAMRHGKAYHSDGHVSSSSADVDTNRRTDRRDAEQSRARPTDTARTSDNEDLQPGQTRKRLRRHDSLDANNALLLDPDSDSSSSSSASSVSSSTSVSITYPSLAEPYTDVDAQGRHKGAEEADETPAPWWSVNRLDSYVPYRERDAIDRMLSRTGGGKPRSKTAVRRSNGASQHRQARLDGFVSAHRHRESRASSSRLHLQEIDQNQRPQQRAPVDKSAGNSHLSKRKKKRPKLDPRVGRTTTSSGRGGPVQLRNPPVVRPRARPRLDLERHDVLFAANPTKTRHARLDANNNGEPGDEDVSDDDGQWQVLSSVVRDSTPVSLLDTRLAVPRSRASGELRGGAIPSITTEGDVAPSPVRGPYASPSVSSASARPVRTHAINDHSPGTPSRARFDAFPPKAQVRSHAGQPTLPLSTTTDIEGSHTWDEFEGISLDFGMIPFAEGKRLDVTGSSLLTRLSDLIALPDRLLGHEHIPRTWSGEVLRLEDIVLNMDMDHEVLANKLPFFVDNLRLTISRTLGEEEDLSNNDATRHVRNLVADTGAFLGCWMVRRAQGAAERLTDPASIFRTYRMILERIEQLQASVLSLHELTRSAKAAREDRKSICLQLAWMRFELCWRAMAICDADANNALEPDAPTVESLLAYSRTLMALLLHHGLHRSVRNLRKAVEGVASSTGLGNSAADIDQDEETTVFVDEATAMWLSVIHLLGSFEKRRGITDGRLFWTQFETTYQRWDESMPKRAPLLRAESLWYCLFALGSLSQVSPEAEIQAASSREYWPLVARALLFVQFRSEESKEMAMGWHMLAKRDAYVRIVLQRCCLLVSEWRWTMDGAEVTLARLFDIFNSHKLADLPTETEHDFPAFLRDFDVKKLSTADVVEGEAMQDPSFHLFVRLLGQAGQELRDHAVEAKEADRRISRLFSRMTPVRVMPFTRTDVPTSSQRSVLFNHYTVVMLFLHLVPTSSPQRLRQIQSFLPAFKDADFVSQVTCVRAMMYVAVIFRHHQLDLDPVIKWFSDTVTALRREYEEIESSTKRYERQQLQHSVQHRSVTKGLARPDAVRMADIFENAPARQAALRRKEEVARLLVVALRSIQHVVRHADLRGEASGTATAGQRLPDQLLLSPAWTQQMLEAQISLEPRVGQEVLKCIQTFLLARIRVLRPDAPKAVSARLVEENHQTVAQPRGEESQDSFAELFETDDGFDFEDPLLARLLDGGDTSTACDSAGGAEGRGHTDKAHLDKKKWDREFGELVKNNISRSLFQLLSNIYHPDRRMEAAATGSVVMSLGVTQRLNELPIDALSSTNGAGRASTARTRMDRLLKAAEARQYLELVVDCWAGCAHVLVTNGLREWSSYLGFGNESWKRIDDAVGRRDVGLRFLQNVVNLDPAALERREYEVEFLAVWVQTAVARVLSVQDVYTRSLIEAEMDVKGKASLLSALAREWQVVIGASSASPAGEGDNAAHSNPSPVTLDLDSFTTYRTLLLNRTYTTLATALANTTTSMGTAYSILSALLSSLRAYVEDTPIGEVTQSSQNGSSLDYLRFCKTTLSDVEVALAGTSVMGSLRSEYGAAVQLVDARLSTVGDGG